MPNVIDSFRGEYRFLSNFYPVVILVDGMHSFPSVENAYQYLKGEDIENWKVFADATPSEAKKLGRTLLKKANWEEIKVDVMHDLVRSKFLLNWPLGQMLLATKSAELIEGNTWGDEFWGVCNGKGLNRLGQILMDVRYELALGR